jgi:hypothetical protein
MGSTFIIIIIIIDKVVLLLLILKHQMMYKVQAADSLQSSYLGLQSQQRIGGHSVFMLRLTHLFPEDSGYRGLASLTRGEDLRGCERIRAYSILVTAFTYLLL